MREISAESVRSASFQGTRHVYERKAVDSYLRTVAAALAEYEQAAEIAAARVTRLERALGSARAKADVISAEAENRAEAAERTANAENEARELVAAAEARLQAAEREATAILAAATRDADGIQSEADAARATHTEQIELARAEAARLVEKAQSEAEQILMLAQDEAAAANDAEQARIGEERDDVVALQQTAAAYLAQAELELEAARAEAVGLVEDAIAEAETLRAIDRDRVDRLHGEREELEDKVQAQLRQNEELRAGAQTAAARLREDAGAVVIEAEQLRVAARKEAASIRQAAQSDASAQVEEATRVSAEIEARMAAAASSRAQAAEALHDATVAEVERLERDARRKLVQADEALATAHEGAEQIRASAAERAEQIVIRAEHRLTTAHREARALLNAAATEVGLREQAFVDVQQARALRDQYRDEAERLRALSRAGRRAMALKRNHIAEILTRIGHQLEALGVTGTDEIDVLRTMLTIEGGIEHQPVDVTIDLTSSVSAGVVYDESDELPIAPGASFYERRLGGLRERIEAAKRGSA